MKKRAIYTFYIHGTKHPWYEIAVGLTYNGTKPPGRNLHWDETKDGRLKPHTGPCQYSSKWSIPVYTGRLKILVADWSECLALPCACHIICYLSAIMECLVIIVRSVIL